MIKDRRDGTWRNGTCKFCGDTEEKAYFLTACETLEKLELKLAVFHHFVKST